MNCPVCETKLRPVDRHGVEIDICPDCKGVWLDRGELDKILEMVGNSMPGNPTYDEKRTAERSSAVRDDNRSRDFSDRQRHDDDDDRHSSKDAKIDPRTGKPRKREGIFGEIFDIFG